MKNLNLKKVTLAISLALAIPFAAVQAYPSGEKMADHVIENLNLDDGRAEEVRQIMQESHAKRMELHKQMREQMRALHAEQHEKLKRVLTEDELKQLHEMKKEHFKEGRKGHHGEHRGHHGKHQSN